MTLRNDAFARRIALAGFDLSTTGANIDFTGELNEPDHAGVSGLLNSAWWTWIAPESGEVTLDTFGSSFDTTLAVYTGNSLATLNEVASNDDSGPGLQSAVIFTAVAGTAYQIAVDGFAGATGDIDLSLQLLADNDDFAYRRLLQGLSADATGTNVGFTGELDEPDHAGAAGALNSAWWTWIAPGNGQATIDTFGSDFDTVLAVYTGESLATLSQLAGNDDSGGTLQSEVTFTAVAGTAYQIAVDGFSTATGTIDLNLDLLVSNDDFSDRALLTGTSATGNNLGFTGETDEPDHGTVAGDLNSAWWTWIAPESGTVTLDTFGSSFDTVLAAYTGDSLATLVEVASNDDSGGTAQSEIIFSAVAGTAYQIAVDGFSTATGDIALNLSLAANNDAFANRAALNGSSASATGTNVNFTGELGEPDHANVSGDLNSAWWTWIAPDSGEVTVDTFGSGFDTTLAVYTGGSLATLSAVASNDDSGSLQSQVMFSAVAGTAYQIAVDGFAGATGDIALTLSLEANNDDFANRAALNGASLSATGTTVGFTGQAGEPLHGGVSGVPNSAWWTWIAPESGTVTIDTFGSDFDTVLAAYTGSSLATLSEVASSDDAGSLQSEITFSAVAGTTYQIAVDGFGDAVGAIDLNLDLSANLFTNDSFITRTVLSGAEASATGSSVGFTGEAGEPDHGGVAGTLNSAWWSWTAADSGTVTVDTFGSDFDTVLAVYTGDSLTTLSEVASNDDTATVQSEVTFNAVAGTTYQIAVDGFGDAAGAIDLNLSLVANNDSFANRTALTGASVSATGTNLGFTGEVNEPDHGGASGELNSAWWTWIAPDSGEVTLDTFGSDFDTTLAVYGGDSLDRLEKLAANDDAGMLLQSQVTFSAVAGTAYQIAVDGFDTATGSISLNLDLDNTVTPPPPVMPTVDLILDFDGGAIEANQSYDIPDPAFDGFAFTGFNAFDQSDGSPGDRNEQIYQILSAVRADFADFNVRVIWDDLGVNSTYYDAQDTVIMVVDESATVVGLPDILGIAANVDVPQFTGQPLQSRRDTGFAFASTHEGIGPNPYNEIRELIDTISHEAGHTFGVSHSSERDSEDRQLVTNVGQNQELDSRFSPEVLDHNPPEVGVRYAETDRMNEAVGAAAVLPGDTQSSQTLPLDPTTPFVGAVSSTDMLTVGGTIDFLGDRDAFRFETVDAGQYTLEQLADPGSLLTSALTLWDAEGDFLALGSSGPSSTITFTADANATYYAIAGSDVDRLASGALPTGEIGGYTLAFG